VRTKTLVVMAAICAASIATSVAQTAYSVNAVGYVNVALAPGFNLVANPLIAEEGSDTIADLFAGVPVGTVLYKFDAATGAYISCSAKPPTGAISGDAAALTLVPGEGVFVQNKSVDDVVVTFVGEVPQGTLTTPLPAGFSIASSQVPQEGALDDDLGFPKAVGDVVYKYDAGTQVYIGFSVTPIGWSSGGGSVPAPVMTVAEAFFVKKAAVADWTREFNVNQ
jgi:hypothetical protein